MTTPHKHAAAIKAWADGQTIQGRGSFGQHRDQWITLGPPGSTNPPTWLERDEFRVKPVDITLREYARAPYFGWTAETPEDLFRVLHTLASHLHKRNDAEGWQLLGRVWRLDSPILKRIDEELK